MRFIREYIQYKNFYGLCDLLLDCTVHNITVNDRDYVGLRILDNFKINYNNNPLTQTKTCGKNIKHDDILYKLDNIIFTDGAELYYENLNCNMPISTYIALNFIMDELIPLEIYKEKDNKTEKINVKACPISLYRIIPISYNNKFFRYKDLIFVELSEDRIDYYSSKELIETINDNFIEYPFNAKQLKLVIIVVTNNSKIEHAIIKNIDKKKITSLDDISNILNNNIHTFNLKKGKCNFKLKI